MYERICVGVIGEGWVIDVRHWDGAWLHGPLVGHRRRGLLGEGRAINGGSTGRWLLARKGRIIGRV